MTVHEVIGRRAGRIAFGAVLVLGMASLVMRALHGELHAASDDFIGMWITAFVARILVGAGVRQMRIVPRGDMLLTASLVVPAVGLALALPLTVHGLWLLLINSGNSRAFDNWFDTSLRVVGFAHVIFALLFAVHARQLATTERPGMSITAIYGWTVLASCVPLGMWILPELITAITGLPILIVMHVFDEIAARERTALPALPRAIVSPCRA